MNVMSNMVYVINTVLTVLVAMFARVLMDMFSQKNTTDAKQQVQHVLLVI